MEGIKLSKNVLWHKKIILFDITCHALMSVTKEIETILKMIMQVCLHYGETTSKNLSDTFGLQVSIVKKLLSFLAKDMNLLNAQIREGIYYYSPIKRSDPSPLKDKQLKYRIVINFSLCLRPLLYIHRKYRIEEVQAPNSVEEISQALLKLNDVLSSNGNSKHSYNIPSDYLSFNIQEGIGVNGQSHASLNWNEGDFIITKNKYEIKHIPSGHPEVSQLRKELEALQSDDILFDKILINIQEKLDDEEFDIDLDNKEGFLNVKILENDIKSIGRVYQIFSEYNGRIIDIPIENDWYYSISIRIDFENPLVSAWIKVLNILENELREEFKIMANKDITKYTARIIALFKSPEVISRTSVSPSKKDIKQVIGNLCMVTNNCWLHLINGKIKESEVVE